MQASPYILPFVKLLEKLGHTVSVIVPDKQRSWIGKAHLLGQNIQSTPYWPPEISPSEHDDSVSIKDGSKYPWILVDSTPATCVQIGISHFFDDRGPVDLVIAGPNFGRNTTAVFALSSGTLGAALEASACGHHAIAVSFAFFDRNHDPEIIHESCTQAVRICEWLAKNGSWGNARLYSINVPVRKGVTDRKIVWTRMLQNQWKKGACFQEMPDPNAVDDPNTEEAKLREQQGAANGSGQQVPKASAQDTRHFKWAPRFTDVFDSVDKAGPGYDGWTVKEGETSVTALHANFQHAEGYTGELDLSSTRQSANI